MGWDMNARIPALVVTAGIALAAMAGTSAAQGLSWSKDVIGPVIYQTNFYYTSSSVSPPNNVPSTAKVTSIYWQIRTSSVAPAGLKLWLFGSNSHTGWQLSGLSGSSQVSGTPVSGAQPFYFQYLVSQATTHVLTQPYITGTDSMGFNVSY
ncbi:MAG: flagellar protein FlhE [Telmatospirillum sp.]|nr:flagellar protein FlhE [Telmatospirillum sp.]